MCFRVETAPGKLDPSSPADNELVAARAVSSPSPGGKAGAGGQAPDLRRVSADAASHASPSSTSGLAYEATNGMAATVS